MGCCDEAKRKDQVNRQRAKRGDPDDEDDVKPIHPTTVPTGGGGGTGGGGKGGGGTKPEPPTPKPKDPTPEPPKEPGPGEWVAEYGFYIQRDFYLISSLGSGRYLDVVDQKNVVIKTPNEYDSQKWYFDWKTKTIRNRMYKHKSLDIANGGSSDDLQIWNANGQWFQVFVYTQNYVINKRDGRCLTVNNGSDTEG